MSALNVDGWMALDAINCVRQIATGAAAAAGLSLYRNSVLLHSSALDSGQARGAPEVSVEQNAANS